MKWVIEKSRKWLAWEDAIKMGEDIREIFVWSCSEDRYGKIKRVKEIQKINKKWFIKQMNCKYRNQWLNKILRIASYMERIRSTKDFIV